MLLTKLSMNVEKHRLPMGKYGGSLTAGVQRGRGTQGTLENLGEL